MASEFPSPGIYCGRRCILLSAAREVVAEHFTAQYSAKCKKSPWPNHGDSAKFRGSAKAYAPNLRRTMPARPTRPVPISIRLLGSGTADVVTCS
jgi:hypothetical protein